MKLFKVAFVSFLVGLSGAVMPGPLFAIAVQQALLIGWTAGFWLINGHAIGEAILLLMIGCGAGKFLTRPTTSKIIGIVGGMVLLYFAFDMVLTALNGSLMISTTTQTPSLSIWKLMLAGLVISVTNPTWYIWWGTAGISLITSQLEKNGKKVWLSFFAGHILADYTWYLLVTVILSFSKTFITLQIYKSIIIICALTIFVIGMIFLIKSLKINRLKEIT
jgi:threonine/homoserine/homoserine lactone efflux protein